MQRSMLNNVTKILNSCKSQLELTKEPKENPNQRIMIDLVNLDICFIFFLKTIQ